MKLSLTYLLIVATLSLAITIIPGSVASVRLGQDLCPQEKAYLQTRAPKIKNALEQITGMQLTDNQVPRIAICASGGGCRAALATLGWIQGMEIQAQKRGYLDSIMSAGSLMYNYLSTVISSWLSAQQSSAPTPNNNIVESSPLSLMDATTYFCSLSGSTWAIAGLQYSRMAPTHYLQTISKQLSQSVAASINMESIAKQLIEKHDDYGQPISFIDIYGNMLGNRFLTGLGATDINSIDLTAYASLADTAQSPFPIHTAIFDNHDAYEWVEFTPYEVGSTYLGAFIPTWAFGRKFNAGSSLDFAPPQPLGYGMGLWGSGMSLNTKEFFDLIVEPGLETINSNYLASHFSSIVAQAAPHLTAIYNDIQDSSSPLLEDRISPAQVFNWVRGISNTPCNTLDTLTLTDAGININVSVPPALRPERAVDIIIILDATRGMMQEDLVALETYVTNHSLHMPQLDFSKINQVCSVHQNPSDPLAPIVIYMPLIQIPAYNSTFDPETADFSSTFNFEYTQDQITMLTGLTKYSMQQSRAIITDAIKQWIASHS